jgi:hypothetical protein
VKIFECGDMELSSGILDLAWSQCWDIESVIQFNEIQLNWCIYELVTKHLNINIVWFVPSLSTAIFFFTVLLSVNADLFKGITLSV